MNAFQKFNFSRFSIIFKNNSMLFYLVLAFAISWTIWFIEPFFRTNNSLAANCLIIFGSYGPVAAAMIVSAISNPQRVKSPIIFRTIAGGLVLITAIYCNWPAVYALRAGLSNAWLWILLGFLTLLPAYIFFSSQSKISGVRDLLGSLLKLNVPLFWFVTALFFMLALSVSGALITSLLNGQPLFSFYGALLSSESLKNLPLTLMATALYGGPVGEEAGWRGFALPRLQKRFNPLAASVFLGLIWGFWHLPLHVTGYYNAAFGNPINGLLMRAITTIPLAIIFTWLYNRSGGNLLVMVILHTAVNVTSSLINTGLGMFIVTAVAVIFMIVFDRMYRKLPSSTTEDKLESIGYAVP